MTEKKKTACREGTPASGKDGKDTEDLAVCGQYTTKDRNNQQVLRRAVKIAARVLNAAGLCRYDDPAKCRRVWPPEEKTCEKCIERWLLAKARKELGDG